MICPKCHGPHSKIVDFRPDRAHSRHRSIATLMLCVDEHDRQRTQTTLADLVANSLTE
jgi:hypothetical protein